jgi:exopolyphosphatase / guanosine-5'-triphosphate,3'-diphosphate pyrophosphatase
VESPDPDLVLRTIGRLGLDGRPNISVPRALKSMLGWGPKRFAVIDVGTNSVKFAVGHLDEEGSPQIEVESAVVARLGEGLVAAGGLTAASMDRTVDAIEDLVEDARREGPLDIVAVGTAGLRQASNRDEFLAAVQSRCGVTVEVISGREEARLAYMAAVSTLPLAGDRLLVFDSGGGSSQFTFGSADRIDEQFSVDVGAVRFAERFGLADAVPRETVDAALDAIATDLAELADRPRPDMVIAMGGTSTNLAAIAHGLDHYDPDAVHATVLDADEVDRQIEVFRTRSAEERREIAGLQPARAEVILAGACVVRTILTLTGQDSLTVSDRGLRHGVIAERFGSPDPQ